jgi:hypothetical protein
MGTRTTGILITAIISTACLAPASAAFGSVAATTAPDPCALITSAAAGALAKPYTLESAEAVSPTMCEYQLRQVDFDAAFRDGPVILSVDSLEDYKLSKAIGVKKVKAVKGLGVAGYRAVDGAGEPVVGFKGKKQSVRLSGGFDAATLIALAKTFSKQVK